MRKYQVRFRGGITEKEHSYLAGILPDTSDGRKLGLDQRIVNQMLPDEPGTKVNQCVDNIMQIWRDGKADKLTQLVFCDISTPQAKAPASKAAKTLDNPLLHALEGTVPLPEQEPAFTVYDDIRQKLIVQGMPADQIAFIHEADVYKRQVYGCGQFLRYAAGGNAKQSSVWRGAGPCFRAHRKAALSQGGHHSRRL